jgi:hypothetical protein
MTGKNSRPGTRQIVGRRIADGRITGAGPFPLFFFDGYFPGLVTLALIRPPEDTLASRLGRRFAIAKLKLMKEVGNDLQKQLAPSR